MSVMDEQRRVVEKDGAEPEDQDQEQSQRRRTGVSVPQFVSAEWGQTAQRSSRYLLRQRRGWAFAEADLWRSRGGTRLPVFFEHGAGGAAGVGIEADAFAVSDGLDGDDVPDVFRDDVGDEEVDFFAGIDFAAGSGGFDAVAGFGVEGGGFDLNAEESAAEFDDGVVAVAVSPGDADGEAEIGGAGEEGGFGGFSAALAGGLGDGVDGDDR